MLTHYLIEHMRVINMTDEIDIVLPLLPHPDFRFGWGFLESIGYNPAAALIRIMHAKRFEAFVEDLVDDFVADVVLYMDIINDEYRHGKIEDHRFISARRVAEIMAIENNCPENLLKGFVDVIWRLYSFDIDLNLVNMAHAATLKGTEHGKLVITIPFEQGNRHALIGPSLQPRGFGSHPERTLPVRKF